MKYSIYLKKCAKTLFVLVGLSSFVANATELKDIDAVKTKTIETEIIEHFSNPTSGDSEIEGIRQIGDSSNYIFKYKENNSYYTMIYMEDIKSVFIQATGELFDLKSKRFITKDYNAVFAKGFIDEIDLKEAITFESKGKKKADEIFVFTDPTCGYCKKLHREIDEYLDRNITVHFLPFPRGGLTGHAYSQLVNSTCSDNPKEALHTAQLTDTVPVLPADISPAKVIKCKKIIEKYYNLGAQMGVTGTPAIFSKNGNQLGGYVPAARLRTVLNEENK